MAGTNERSTEQVRRDIETERERLATAVDDLRAGIGEATNIGAKLKGKLHVIVGELDTFYLEGAVKLLKESLAKLGSDAVVEMIPNRDHSTVLDVKLAERLDREMQEALASVYPSRREDPK